MPSIGECLIKLQYSTQWNTKISKVNKVLMLSLLWEEENKKTKYVLTYLHIKYLCKDTQETPNLVAFGKISWMSGWQQWKESIFLVYPFVLLEFWNVCTYDSFISK